MNFVLSDKVGSIQGMLEYSRALPLTRQWATSAETCSAVAATAMAAARMALAGWSSKVS
jgi:hypothetical protein